MHATRARILHKRSGWALFARCGIEGFDSETHCWLNSLAWSVSSPSLLLDFEPTILIDSVLLSLPHRCQASMLGKALPAIALQTKNIKVPTFWMDPEAGGGRSGPEPPRAKCSQYATFRSEWYWMGPPYRQEPSPIR